MTVMIAYDGLTKLIIAQMHTVFTQFLVFRMVEHEDLLQINYIARLFLKHTKSFNFLLISTIHFILNNKN